MEAKSLENSQPNNQLLSHPYLPAIKFKQQILLSNIYVHPLLKQIIQTSSWKFNYREWQQWKCGFFMSLILSTNTQLFLIVSLPKQTFLSDVCNINFESLTQLYLGNNSIVNPQFISMLNAPLVQRLALSNNYISNFQSLRKANFKSLNYLGLVQNKFNDLDFLCQIQSKQINAIHLQIKKQNKTQCEWNSWILKIQSKKLSKLVNKNENRVSLFDQYIKMMRKKFIRLPRQ